MSVQMMGAVIGCGPRDRGEYGVLLALANYADEFGFAWPSLATLAHDSRYDERSTRRIVDDLEGKGWLHVGRKVLNSKSNVYILNLDRMGVKVPGDARRSPLFLRLTVKYPDKMSPIFCARKSPDMPKFSEDNPQGVTGQNGGESPDKNGGVTGQAMSSKPLRTVTKPSGTTILLRTSPTPPGEGCETEAAEDADRLEPKCGREAAALWERLKDGLAKDLGGRLLPAGTEERFRPVSAGLSPLGPEIQPGVPTIREGVSDFDLCFSAWWLHDVRVTRVGTRWEFVTQAWDEAATEAGLAKYAGRLARLARSYFPIPKEASIAITLERAPGEPGLPGSGP